MHDESLTEGRDVLKNEDEKKKRKWLTKDGQDWSGAFTHDPKAYMDSAGRKRAEPGVDQPVHDPHDPSDDDDNIEDGVIDDDSDSSSDLGLQDAENRGSNENSQAQGLERSETEQKKRDEGNKKTEKRKHRGMLQWKPVRVRSIPSKLLRA